MKKFRTGGMIAGVAALAVALVPGASFGTPPKQPPKQKPPKGCSKQNPKKCPTAIRGRMTGHGHFIHDDHGKVQWEFRNSVCNARRFPDLKVEWGRNKFRLTSYVGALTCVDLPGVNEEHPVAGFDTIVGQGPGLLNGKPAHAVFTFTDAGEPGRNDYGSVKIVQDGDVVLEFTDEKAGAGGNHQAHRR